MNAVFKAGAAPKWKSSEMAQPAAALVRLRRSVGVMVNLPATDSFPPHGFSGELTAAMYVDRAVHHFRVVDKQGVMWFVWPSCIVGAPPVMAPGAVAEAVA